MGPRSLSAAIGRRYRPILANGVETLVMSGKVRRRVLQEAFPLQKATELGLALPKPAMSGRHCCKVCL